MNRDRWTGATVTDLYEVTMALAYLSEDLTAAGHLQPVRRALPAERGFLVAAGLADVLDHLDGFAVDETDIAVLAAAANRPEADLAPLRGLRFTGEVRAVPEGSIVFADEPLLEVTAPLPQAQLVETCCSTRSRHQTALASKAARCVLAAGGRPVIDFSLRRTHGIEAGLHAARAGAIVGFAGTSNVAAAAAYGLPAVGHHGALLRPGLPRTRRPPSTRSPGPPPARSPSSSTPTTPHAGVQHGDRRAARATRRTAPSASASTAVTSPRSRGAPGAPRRRRAAPGPDRRQRRARRVRASRTSSRPAPRSTSSPSARRSALRRRAVARHGLQAGRVRRPAGDEAVRGQGDRCRAPSRCSAAPGCADLLALRDEKAPPSGRPLLETVVRDGRRVRPRLSERAAVEAARRRFDDDLADLPAAARLVRRPTPARPTTSAALRELTTQVRNRMCDEATGSSGMPVNALVSDAGQLQSKAKSRLK